MLGLVATLLLHLALYHNGDGGRTQVGFVFVTYPQLFDRQVGGLQSVVDDGRHELSRTTYDIPVYLCHLDSLLVLHQNIVQQFLILRVLLDPAVSCQLVKNYSIRSQ